MCHRVSLGWKVPLALLTLLVFAGWANAYVGPEADPVTLGYFTSLMSFVLVALSSILLWPVYALIRFVRRGRNPASEPTLATTPAIPSSSSTNAPEGIAGDSTSQI